MIDWDFYLWPLDSLWHSIKNPRPWAACFLWPEEYETEDDAFISTARFWTRKGAEEWLAEMDDITLKTQLH